MIAARVSPKALSSYMGHSSIHVTLDKYGPLMPGNEEEAARLMDEYLRREHERTARAAEVRNPVRDSRATVPTGLQRL